MKKTKLLTAAAFIATLFLPSCVTNASALDVDRVGPLIRDVTRRHDQMLNGELDPTTISELDKQTYLRSSQILNAIVDQAQVNQGQTTPEPAPEPMPDN